MPNDSKQLLPAYLAVGEDALKRRTVLERLRKRVSQEGDLEFNHDEFDGANASGSDIAISCNTVPFASPLRLVEVKNVGKLGKADMDVLVAYLASPSESTVLALSGDKLAANTKLYKAVSALGKSAVIDCKPMKRYELVKALRSMAVGHGFTLTSQAAEKLVSLVGEDTVRIDTELAKLALAHTGTQPVSKREVAMLVSQTKEAKPWDFVDAFSRRDAKRCLALLPLLTSTSSYALLAMCTNRLREIVCTQSLTSRGQVNQLAKVLGVRDWLVKNHASYAKNFTDAELRHAIITSRDCEQAMKSGADPDETFKQWFITVIA